MCRPPPLPRRLMFGVIDCEIMSGLKEMGYSNQMRINLFIIHVTFILYWSGARSGAPSDYLPNFMAN